MQQAHTAVPSKGSGRWCPARLLGQHRGCKPKARLQSVAHPQGRAEGRGEGGYGLPVPPAATLSDQLCWLLQSTLRLARTTLRCWPLTQHAPGTSAPLTLQQPPPNGSVACQWPDSGSYHRAILLPHTPARSWEGHGEHLAPPDMLRGPGVAGALEGWLGGREHPGHAAQPPSPPMAFGPMWLTGLGATSKGPLSQNPLWSVWVALPDLGLRNQPFVILSLEIPYPEALLPVVPALRATSRATLCPVPSEKHQPCCSRVPGLCTLAQAWLWDLLVQLAPVPTSRTKPKIPCSSDPRREGRDPQLSLASPARGPGVQGRGQQAAGALRASEAPRSAPRLTFSLESFWWASSLYMFQLFSKLLEGKRPRLTAPASDCSTGRGPAEPARPWPGSLGTVHGAARPAAWLPGGHPRAGVLDSRLRPQHTRGRDQQSSQPVQPRGGRSAARGGQSCTTGGLARAPAGEWHAMPPRTRAPISAGLPCPRQATPRCTKPAGTSGH